jgi:diguanylate cyclase (GGDEF)-like protein
MVEIQGDRLKKISETNLTNEKRSNLAEQILGKIKNAKTEDDKRKLATDLAEQINDYRKIARINEKTSQVWKDHAHIDVLTGLNNRRSAEDNLKKEIEDAQKYSYPLSILMADVDDLKLFNDKSEDHHSLGDKAIKEAGNAIQAGVREIDFVARWGGDEFLVILPYSDKENATVVTRRILDEVEKIALISNKKLSISIGIGQWQANEKPEELFNRVDKAVYQVKESKKESKK